MTLVAVCQTCEGAHIIECMLIDKYKEFRCSDNNEYNDRGGTGRPRANEDGLWYVYMLTLRADLPMSPRMQGWGARVD